MWKYAWKMVDYILTWGFEMHFEVAKTCSKYISAYLGSVYKKQKYFWNTF